MWMEALHSAGFCRLRVLMAVHKSMVVAELLDSAALGCGRIAHYCRHMHPPVLALFD